MVTKSLDILALGQKNLIEKIGYNNDQPFINYVLEDKSSYVKASSYINPEKGRPYVDLDDDFRIGGSGGLLMNIDFVFVDAHKFSPAAAYYEKYGEYCSYNPDTMEYRNFWAKETKRRRAGVKARCKLYFKDIVEYYDIYTTDERRKELLHYVRITGDHYNYLNYGRIERTLNDEERKRYNNMGLYHVNTIEGFPTFWDGDYWNFKIDEFIANNGYNLCKAKSRRKGFSYKRGSQAANTVNLIKNVTVTLLAYDITYLTGAGKTASMVKNNLDWYENKTYWRRGFLSEPLDEIELGYKKSKEGNKKYGFKSKVVSFATKVNAAKAIGGKSLEIDLEEGGKFKNARIVLNLIRDNMKSGKVSVGTLRMYGTGGEKDADWADFDYIFNNPSAYDMLPMENVWDINSRHKVCGFFFPYIWNCEPYIHDGNSLLFEAWKQDKIDDAQRRKDMSSEDYTIARSQNANSPAEAFINTTDNIFLSPDLITHIDNLKNDNRYKFYTDGWYAMNHDTVKFFTKEECIAHKLFPTSKSGWHSYIKDVPHQPTTDIHGCVREYFPPPIDNNSVLEDACFISVDPYRVDRTSKEVTVKHSLYSFQVWAKTHAKSPYRKGQLLAEYCGRLNTMEANDWLLYLACRRWNAKALIEAGTGETVSNFKKWKAVNYLAFDPTAIADRILGKARTAAIGVVIGDGDKKLDGLLSLRDFMYEAVSYTIDKIPILRLHECYSLAFCLEMLNFKASGNFDRISSAIVAMFEFRKDAILARSKTEVNQYDNGAVNKNRLAYKLKRRIT